MRVLRGEGSIESLFSESATTAYDRVCEHRAAVLVADFMLPGGGYVRDLFANALKHHDMGLVLVRRGHEYLSSWDLPRLPAEVLKPFDDYAVVADRIAAAIRV